MAVVRRQGNTHLREGSFSSYLDIQTIHPPPRQTSHSSSSSSHSSTSPASRTARSESTSSPARRFRRSQSHRSPLGELMAFRDGRYFREAVEDEDDDRQRKGEVKTDANNHNHNNNGSRKQRKKKKKKKNNGELVCCSSWNSQISSSSMFLLQYPSGRRKNPEKTTSTNKSNKNLLSSGLKFFSGLRCKGSCSDIVKPAALGPGHLPFKDRSVVVVSSSADGKRPNGTEMTAVEVAVAADAASFDFPVAEGGGRKVGGMDSEKGVGGVVGQRDEERKVTVVEMSNDGSEEDDDGGEIEIDLERKVSEVTWDAIARAATTTTTIGGRRRRTGSGGWVEEEEDHDEVGSNGSSDLFEIQVVPDRLMMVSPVSKQDDV